MRKILKPLKKNFQEREALRTHIQKGQALVMFIFVTTVIKNTGITGY